ncbi:MAG: glycosyltransferase family 2 protein [Nitrospiraceae bacterium]
MTTPQTSAQDSALPPPRVGFTSLVIPVFNQLEYTVRCLDSLRRHTTLPYEVIVVDNASTDGTPAYLRELHERGQIRVIANRANLGCAKAWNQGVRAAHGDVIGILNNDIVVTAGWLEGLREFMTRGGHGVVAPAGREGALNYDLDAYAAQFTDRCRAATRAELYGPCFLVARHVFDRVGLFDDAFGYGGCEDVDFHWRVLQAGMSVRMTGSVLIHHFSMVTQTAFGRSERKRYSEANVTYFTQKWGRTVRGNWAQRRWAGISRTVREAAEYVRFGHALVEKAQAHATDAHDRRTPPSATMSTP